MAFKKLSKEWCCVRDFYELLLKYYEASGKEELKDVENYTKIIDEISDFGRKYGVESVLKQPQKDPCAALAFRLSCALADLTDDLMKIGGSNGQ